MDVGTTLDLPQVVTAWWSADSGFSVDDLALVLWTTDGPTGCSLNGGGPDVARVNIIAVMSLGRDVPPPSTADAATRVADPC